MNNQNAKIKKIIGQVIPEDKKPLLTEEQLEKLKTAGAIALMILGVAGAVTLSAIAPNIFWAINKSFYQNKRGRKFTKKEKTRKLARTFYYLKDHGYIRMKPTAKDFKIFFTKLGKRKLKELNFNSLKIERPKSWNGKWWVIAADIPTEDYRWAADLFRNKLREMKFFHLQRTLWFYPYDPRNEIQFIAQHFGIARYVTVIEANRLDQHEEEAMKKFFRKEGIL